MTDTHKSVLEMVRAVQDDAAFGDQLEERLSQRQTVKDIAILRAVKGLTDLTIGWSDFAIKQHTPVSGKSFTTLSPDAVIELVLDRWADRQPGHGEKDLSRKVVVSLSPDCFADFFTPPYVDLSPNLPVRARVTQRQKGEDYYIETYVNSHDCSVLGLEVHRNPAKKVAVVLYSAEALLANNGTRSTDCDWEIVCLLVSDRAENEPPMVPLTMARNQLELPGGTKSEYTPKEFAEAIMYWSAHKGVKVMSPE